MLIGGFLIVKMLCFHLFFRTYEYHSTVELDKNCKRYFKLIGLVIYTAYIELFLEKTPANPDNINEITMINEIPGIITSPLYYSIPYIFTNLFKNKLMREKISPLTLKGISL